MGDLARLFGAERRSDGGTFSLLENPAKDPALAALFGATPSTSGVSVNEQTAMRNSAVFDAVRIISQDNASVPRILYRRMEDGGRERAREHPVYRLLRQPDPEMIGMVFWETLYAHALTWGNAYAEIERTGGGRPGPMHILTPDRVTVARNASRQVVFRVKRENGREDTLRSDQVFHVPGFGFDGLVGYSVLRMAREAIGLGLATERFGAAFFGKGAWAGVVLEHPESLSPEAHLRLKESWNEIHQGSSNAHGVAILEKGMKASKPLTIPPDDAQFLQTREFQVVEVARWFNIAVHKLRVMADAHYNNIEHEGISHVTDTLRPWGVRFEQECDRKLLTEGEKEDYYTEHLYDALQRGDTASRYAAHAVGRQWGWRSVNEV